MASDPNSPITTTFVQADPSTFRAVVQRLTGATPTTTTTTPRPHRTPPFKLHERRHHMTNKLEITLNNNGSRDFKPFRTTTMSPVSRERGFVGSEMMMSSPVSTLDVYGGRSPRTPVEEEDKAIAEKGFYLHPSPLSTPRGNEPELLVLFPLSSPKTDSSSMSS
ncbi:VQ motif-containing protein 11-like protein [Tanacetum coccineum]